MLYRLMPWWLFLVPGLLWLIGVVDGGRAGLAASIFAGLAGCWMCAALGVEKLIDQEEDRR